MQPLWRCAHEQNRDWAIANHGLRVTPKRQMAEATTSVGSHYDQVGNLTCPPGLDQLDEGIFS